MTDLCPISLCNVLVRTLSKVLVNRLQMCLPTLISINQSAFVEGRLLTDNALVAFEINHYIRRKTQGKYGYAGLKIDISKAYDRLEWNFIEGMLGKYGFHQMWISRVMTCIRTVTYSFLQKGEVFGHVNPERGIRQGDPISPYLYILCAEGLSSMIRRNEEVGLIHGCKIAAGAPRVSHLLFADDCYLFFKATITEAATMKNVLNRYEKVSGQAINFNKSNVTFSPNTTAEERRKICETLEVNEVDIPGRYLGIPMVVGRKKKEIFGFLTDKVKQKLHNWKSKKISKAGKHTLLQTSCQVLPNFWMNLMTIPAEVCQVIQRQMNQFWWGNGGQSKGVKWMAWGRMCEAKESGGLGYKDLQQFNLAMLAKQGWRLVNGDNSFVTSIMRARYFPKTDFLNAELGANPSYMWRSILSAQDMVKKGCRRKIGNGTETFVWKVPWLPVVENGMLTTDMPEQLANIKVVGLMKTGERQWDEEVLKDICNERDRLLIMKIALPRRDMEDSWYWMFDEKGEFSVRSCYNQIRGERDMVNATFWRKLWSLKLPGKIVHFVWRACRLCLPTAVDLRFKHVNVETMCSWCHNYEENGIHVLFGCVFARAVREAVGLSDLIQYDPNDNVFDVFLRIFTQCTRNQAAAVALFCWHIWNRRNKWVWDRVNMSVYGTKATATKLLEDWKTAQQEESKQRRGQNMGSKVWQKPFMGWVKINTDAVVIPGTHQIGTGAVIRDEDGRFLHARCMDIAGEWSVREAEARSLRDAVCWTVALGFKKCVFELDSKIVVDACNGNYGRSNFCSIIAECVEDFKHLDEVRVQFTYKSANVVAHTLARTSIFMSGFHEWQGNAPHSSVMY